MSSALPVSPRARALHLVDRPLSPAHAARRREQELAPLQDLIDKLVQRESLPKEAPAEAAAASS